VFLVSRMREEYVHTRDPRRAITTGFTAGARVVTAAAVIMISVFAAFIPHSDMTVKPVALGLAVGVFVDAFIVRMTLVPAVLALLGHHAWWLPRWLDHRLPVLDVEGVGLGDHLEHESWTRDHGTAVVRADNVSVPGVLDPVSLVVHDPTLVVVASDDAAARAALLGALSGRVDTAGRLVVLDRVLPAEGGAVRRQVGLLPSFPTRSQLEHLRQQRLVVVDAVDEFASPDEVDARWATLLSLVSEGAVVVAGASLATSAPEDASVVPLAQTQAQEASL
jgi:RND superfamily putative drug exporter